jgi:hypothetical protein
VVGARQGTDLGSAMLRHRLARADTDGLPTYLEASSPRGRALYLRHGFADLGEPVRVADSQGGVTVSRVGNAVSELLDRVVYMAAYCCVDLPNLNAYLATPENSDSLLHLVTQAVVADPATLGVARVNWRTADPTLIDGIRQCLAGDFTDEEMGRLLNMLEPDEPVTIPLAEARGEARTWGHIPRTYVRFTEDRLIPPALQDRFIREADRLTANNPTDVHSVAAPAKATTTTQHPVGNKEKALQAS